jgi:type VI secretion system secreted protein VgrG
MLPPLRRSIPVLVAALAIGHVACDSTSPQRTPTGPLAKPPGGEGPSAAMARPGSGEGRLSAMAVAPPLGAAGSFAVVGASTVTNTGPTVVNGDLGVSPGTAVVGFPPGIVSGTIHAADAAALAAQTSITAAYNTLAGQACDVNLTGQDLGGLTLTPGVYCFSSSAQLTGTLTLNALGNPGAVWVFQIGSTLTTASGSRVVFINGGQACGAFWQVGSSATLGTTTSFAGNVLALASITLTTGATNTGAVFARNGAVTMDSNVVSTVGSCGSGPQPSPTPFPGGPTPPPVPTLPEMATVGLLAILLVSGALLLGRR